MFHLQSAEKPEPILFIKYIWLTYQTKVRSIHDNHPRGFSDESIGQYFLQEVLTEKTIINYLLLTEYTLEK